MGVAVERPLGVSVLRLVARQVPDDQRLVTAGGQEHVGAAERREQRSASLSSSGHGAASTECARKRLIGGLFVLLHGGSQASDPAILITMPVSIVCPFTSPSIHPSSHLFASLFSICEMCPGAQRASLRMPRLEGSMASVFGSEALNGNFDKTYVALEGTLENQLLSLLSHICPKRYSCRSGSTPRKENGGRRSGGWRRAC